MKNLARKLVAMTAAAIWVGALSSPASAAGGDSRANGEPAARVAFESGSGRLVVDWNKELLKIEQTPGAQPASIHPTRSFAILHAAMYDAVVSITRADAPYAFAVVAGRRARPDAAADQAAHDTLAALFPSLGTLLDQMLAAELATVPDGTAKQAGVAVGKRVATLVLALRADDGSAATPAPFVPGAQPGDYQLTPPNFPNPVFTNWGSVSPWVLDAGDQFRPPPPPPLSSPTWAAAINEVQSLGQDTSTSRTPDQTTIGKFWAPPIWNTWNEIADGQVVGHRSNLEDAAHVFASLNLTFADSVIAFYDAKYHYQLWRPVTAIRAGTPNNPAAHPADPAWNPLAVTAADPSYPAAHSTISAAAATVLSAFFGDHVHFAATSAALAGVTRSFDNFQAAANEATSSRIFAGQHTRIDLNAGLALGRRVANAVLTNALPARTDSAGR